MSKQPINYEKRCAELEGVIANAIVALDDRLMGDLGRILRTGSAKPILSTVGVVSLGGAR